ncbi:MAG: hypothetical protein ACD_17C00382G0002 [uncultured bacterium]|nr:MAG: hypothetical protein ACD_17C00382G0002 [uncultured bacterium]OGN55810.1 MAG: hypothetical protein A2796_04240 [Chlamydiae bacterium RIFCSPHIGHO2_01_FULL_44_39]OGN58313.1 MAG: hypothetical protein A3C42_00990 [Chlamydiae bacterium RIFCSPHIGHO2_02_FULL_45_9]OGN60342.1 MAG: hypothetical protein A3D96_04465 [Chlamydiae bacterium RIFCSPHIGHO2_12_FULL_44_59]OGN66325.1 MAG: hypothetical protein A2978_01910 [Chlamydiae bacterium RIFCSPLOWO2_01_FULL_44_52]OGN69276.1 MAG: hypothetical protein A3
MVEFNKQTTQPDLAKGSLRIPLPKIIGPYKIESQLSKGGMSLLYLAIHPETQKPLVIKVLLPKFVQNQELANRFLKEAHIIETTNHPNIVKLYGQGKWERGLYIAMEFIQGISLRQFIQKKSLSLKRALEIIQQVAYALCHLHTHGIIHRDLKPENILITESGEIKLIDFGIAQQHAPLDKERLTKEKKLMGTPIYMSPEQKQNPSSVTFSTDIYSLGILSYELILGRLSHGVIHLNLLSKPIRAILGKALEPDPTKRYQDIVDFLTDLSEYIAKMDEHKEEQPEEASEDMLNLIDETKKLLIDTKAPKWPQLEIAVAIHQGSTVSGLYLEFFHLSKNRYCIALAKSMNSGIPSLLHTSILRGMVRIALQKEEHPLQILNHLNLAIHSDRMGQRFSLTLLFLIPEKDQLIFLSCQSSHLYLLPEGSQTARLLTTPNPLLGAEENPALLETAYNWNIKDRLFLLSDEFLLPNRDDSWLFDHLMLSLQPQIEKILQIQHDKQKPPPQGASFALTVQRVF